MKSKFMKKLVSLSLCAFLALGSLSSIKCFAALRDIGTIGGSYENVIDAKKRYNAKRGNGFYSEDQAEYECHHLISKQALNNWGQVIRSNGWANFHNEFLTKDETQNWAPSITMEKADHEKTLSYYNRYTRTDEQNQKALDYINWQSYQIICGGDIIGVLKEECDYIQKTFGSKYDEALKQVREYIYNLECRWTENSNFSCTCLKINNPYYKYWPAFYYPYPLV